jgi:2-desacetyl-2-hydroxyethyl bacteriochlorophyllide A dehydrogenase
MKQITLEAPFKFIMSEAPDAPSPGPGEALVRVHRVGICGTDLHAFRGRQPFFTYPRVLGHELGVEVLALGAGAAEAGLRVGDRCSVEPYLSCGQCIACRRGKTNCCATLQVLGVHVDGGMRDAFVVPAHKLHVANDLDYEQLALIETLGIGAHAVDRAQIERDECVLVIGAGPIGLSVLQFAQLASRRVFVLDTNQMRLSFARKHFRVEAAFTADEGALEAVRRATDGDLPTVVFDATGSAASMTRAFEFVAPGGKLVFVGLVQDDITFHDPFFHRREITLLATRNALARDFTRIQGLVRSGAVDTRPWITHRADAADMIDAFPHWLRPETGVLKAIVGF